MDGNAKYLLVDQAIQLCTKTYKFGCKKRIYWVVAEDKWFTEVLESGAIMSVVSSKGWWKLLSIWDH